MHFVTLSLYIYNRAKAGFSKDVVASQITIISFSKDVVASL
jgi:hypothetical protein